MLTGDMNHDNKLDLVWGQNVYLSNGDGTFTLFPMNLPVQTGSVTPPLPSALVDLNGDGVLDVVAGSGVYAGYGNGSVQSAPFFSPSLPLSTVPGSIPSVVGDINADGHPDLILLYEKDTAPVNNFLAVYLGDGAGHFTTDSNSYTAGSHPNSSAGTGSSFFLTRLNNQAPAGSADRALDLLLLSNGGATSLLNQNNPPPGAAQPVPSRTQLTASATSLVTNQDLTLTVTVTGIAPTGKVTFRSPASGGVAELVSEAPITNGIASLTTGRPAGTYSFTASYSGDTNNNPSTSNTVTVIVTPAASTTTLSASSTNVNLGQMITYTATVAGRFYPTGTVTFTSGATTLGTVNVAYGATQVPFSTGVATLPAFATTAGTYSVTASYSGDDNNQPSTSSAVSITVVTPDYTLTANPAAATVKAGQSVTIAVNMTAVGGYNGTVKLACGSLPAEVACTFSPASLTPSGASATSSTLTITTTAPSTAMLEHHGPSSTRLAVWAVLLGLCLSPRRVMRSRKHLARIMTTLLLSLASLVYLAGCSSSSSTPKDMGTPTGTQSIAITGADSGTGPSHTLNIQLTVQ